MLWSVTSATDSVKLYSDAQCTTEIGTDAKSANCNVTVASSADFIKVQPQDVVVAYPDGASFSVEVANPDLVASYQWHMIDQDKNDFVLDGETGDD